MKSLSLRDNTPIQNAYKYGFYKELTPEIVTAAETYNIRRLQQQQNEILEQSNNTLAQGMTNIQEQLHDDNYKQRYVMERGFNQVESGFYALSD
jgi:hypothetical protein